MKWYEKFKVGQRVKVVKKVHVWGGGDSKYCYGASWPVEMDRTIGKIYEIIKIDKEVGYRLCTEKEWKGPYPYNYWYPMESLGHVVGEQLLFDFME